jgi:hypothetical protein
VTLGKNRSSGTEPYTGRTLSDYIVKKHGGKHTRTTGSHIFYELPNGVVVGSVKHNQQVTRPHASDLAEKLGLTYAEFRAEIGHPIKKAGTTKHKPVRRIERRGVTRSQVTRLIAAIRGDLDDAMRGLAGDRDPSVYERMFEELQPAASHVAKARDFITKRGAA